MWLYLIGDLVKTSQRNDLSGTVHSASYESCGASAIWPLDQALIENFPAIHAAKFPINKKNLFFSKSWQIACPWHLKLVSSTDVLIYVYVISDKQSIFQSDPHAVIPNKLAFTDKPSHKHDSNKYQSKAFLSATRDLIRPDLWRM